MEMLIDYVDFASKHHTSVSCENQCFTSCNNGCLDCLDKQNYRGQQRTYDCEKRCGAYVCHYIFRFLEEMRFLYTDVELLNSSVKVLSIGCGPCSELFPLDEMMAQQFEVYSIDFVGIDSSDKWRPFHDEIDRLILAHQKPIETRFITGDAMSELNQLPEEEFDIIVMSYFLSDYRKLHNRSITPVRQFCRLLNDTVISRMPNKSYVLLNDINHFLSRDCFDALISAIRRSKVVNKYRFNKPYNVQEGYTRSYSNRGNPITTIPKKYLDPSFQLMFNPWTDCSSAQVIVEVS